LAFNNAYLLQLSGQAVLRCGLSFAFFPFRSLFLLLATPFRAVRA
jgi:hypothetical protein